ncbi:long-chain acyl-CoA synthetase [Pseudonocardia ammonioxydans]|uniref:Long-chain acyl-CoA synthetase n=1 Tax=Pseudonocardia ammonioxydans TaxID=260086 RepID=A0A1I5D3T4_PSUAM|nr:long-chain acyl-CoA synthetase [Pseudonocardia ammonioxydans]
MHEYTAPGAVDIADDASLADAVTERARSEPDAVLLRRRVAGTWQPVPAAEFAARVAELAAGLIAAGVRAGDRLAILGRTRYEWTLVDYAAWTAGAVVVPIYETSSAEQARWILGDSGAVGVVVETAAHAETVGAVREHLPELAQVWQIEAGGLDELARAGRSVRPASSRGGGRRSAATASRPWSTPRAPPAGPRAASSPTATCSTSGRSRRC